LTSRRQSKSLGKPSRSVTKTGSVSPPVRVFISYAHDDVEHEDRVLQLWIFLRQQGIDAQLDVSAAEQRQDWPTWTLQQIRNARFVLAIASPAYRRRAEGEAEPHEGRGVQWEAMLIREKMYSDQHEALNKFLPVVLPGCSASDIPAWMGPTSTTHYVISDYTVKGAEKLLRLLTDQPSGILPPLGSMPVLPPRSDLLPYSTAEAMRRALLQRLADRTGSRNEAMVQSDVRQLLLIGGLGIDEDELGAAAHTQVEDQRRIPIDRALTVIEVRKDLRANAVVKAAEQQLGRYIAARYQETGEWYVAVLTDGTQWNLYHSVDGELQQATSLTIDTSAPAVDKLMIWLEAVLATAQQIKPTPDEIGRKLGADSPAHILDAAELAAIYRKNRDRSTVKLKRNMWARLLTTAQGTVFTDDDSLFVDHTLLVLMAELIGHAVLGFEIDNPAVRAKAIVTGELFSEKALIGGVVEADFFDWIADVPGGQKFVKNLARRLARFAWDQVEHDVLKELYQSIISQETRKLLGEYYTPDWLAEAIVAECVNDPLRQRVLDASCGSGTFLFHAIRRYLEAAEAAEMSNSDVFRELVRHVIGIDVHPVACTLARVTYLLAIGTQRLRAHDRPAFAVPVYLGDSLRWGQEAQTIFYYEGLSVPTADNREMFVNDTELSDEIEFTDQLKFPSQVVADVHTFDLLVAELADKAMRRPPWSKEPSLTATFERFNINSDDRPVLKRTFKNMCSLHDQGKDHIWGYYVRNLVRPLWLSRPGNRIDVLIGNPPWLSYRYMTRAQQGSFREMSARRGLWAGGTSAPSQDLSALFVVRCIEQYLKIGGRFGYVMPWGILSRRQYAGFRSGSYPSQAEPVKVGFDRPWDLHMIKPTFFLVPASVVFGERRLSGRAPETLTLAPELWSGRLVRPNPSPAEIAATIMRAVAEPAQPFAHRTSPYAGRFMQGATIVPRFLFFIRNDSSSPLGSGANRRAVKSRRTVTEKKPWKDLPALHGTIEEEFVRPIYLGDTILPFRCLEPLEAVIPWDRNSNKLLNGSSELIDEYQGLARWWRAAETIWMQHRSSTRLSLIERLDYRHGLSQQFPIADHRVVYSASGMYLAAAVVTNPNAIIEHKLYWAPADTYQEAQFLAAVLNSTSLTNAVRPLQARGEHNPRDFDKYVFQLPIPPYDHRNSSHQELVGLAERSSHLATSIDLPMAHFQAQRRKVRKVLTEEGVLAEIDTIVKRLLT
jgi:SAM-dependent methyltransferase